MHPAKRAEAQDAKLPTEKIKLPDSTVEFEMVKVPAPPGGKQFWIGKNEVTWGEYDTFSQDIEFEELPKGEQPAEGAIARPSKPYGERYRGFGGGEMPVLGVHYNAAQIYCRWLSAKTGKKYRLPTEAEWEWIAQAGGKGLPAKFDDEVWHAGNAQEKPHAIGTKKPNAWGLHDTLGNLAELVQVKEGEKATVCGGSFLDAVKDVTFKARKTYDPKWQETDAQFPKSVWWYTEYGNFVGIRVVREE